MSGQHWPTPDDQLDQHAYDVCQHCGLPIVQHWQDRQRWVTMTSGNTECYGQSGRGIARTAGQTHSAFGRTITRESS